MDITTVRIIATLVSFACFIGILVWAFSRRNRARFDEAAQLPFAEQDAPLNSFKNEKNHE
ncbi:cbb3-type cytochrome c oxidase subunit 3 [Acidovorax sp. GBBC 3334]|uniref:Cytochrome c oxidase cbb3-type subunit 4 n=1 Tax=Paracidovorax konjaci TaxID=32040 RepID=A0A1I1WVI7_9BURK|nr:MULTISPECIES: cbb3-type cytochrome c oxidase subunit 3 [Comamonadaceae]MDA8454191.1 cbb3-type cytochrome c oxidase subunit 3 [Acidovorax sp. GBBC 3334]MDA8520062.1 cbb3-type cytochrome c oxidase subunit 3 [Acidovorax sp. NCPPB 4044]SFD99147.1 cytochrome c oxidase cbb3-type subunit 4 [Paracidovorax konjaci]